MALWEELQVIAMDYASLSSEEVEDDLQWHLSLIPAHHRERMMHNSEGWLAECAFSEKCLALGHKPGEDGEDGDPDWDQHYADGDHVYGWDAEMICVGTKHGIACSECESPDCEYDFGRIPSIWEMVSAKEESCTAQ